MAAKILRYIRPGTVSITLLTLLIVASLFFLAQARHDANQIKPGYIVLFAVILFELFILIILITKGLIRLLRQYRNQAIGSRLTLRLFLLFVSLSLIPVSIVYLFSLQFIYKSIDAWLDNDIGTSIQKSVQLNQNLLDAQARNALALTKNWALRLKNSPDEKFQENLHTLRIKHKAFELVLFTENGDMVSFSNAQESLPLTMKFNLVSKKDTAPQFSIQEIDDSGMLYIKTSVPLESNIKNSQHYFLNVLFSINPHISHLAKEIQTTHAHYQKIVFLRPVLKTSFTITLSLVLLLCLLTAIWAAFYASSRIVSPLRVLAIGTRAIAAGHYKKILPQTSQDEIGLLVSSFNQMTHNIAEARDEANKHQKDVEQQRAYLESILGNISSGVIVLDRHLHLQTFNNAAQTLLGLALTPCIGLTTDQIKTENENLRSLLLSFHNLSQKGTEKGWQMEQPFRNMILACKGTPFITQQEVHGHIILFNDITALIQAQKNAAWSEVAERLAHEIKNPLTPIQLSAERLSRKFEKSTHEEFATILKRSTHTITQQVDTLKEMINAFNEYARPPKLHLRNTCLNTLITETVALYDGLDHQAEFLLTLSDQVPELQLDSGRIRQLLHNLIKNALEAVPDQDFAKIEITTACTLNSETPCISLVLKDNGSGFSTNLLEKIFEPYVTNKVKGSGLGLAIAKKIIEEHHGNIEARNRRQGGACIIIHFPVL